MSERPSLQPAPELKRTANLPGPKKRPAAAPRQDTADQGTQVEWAAASQLPTPISKASTVPRRDRTSEPADARAARTLHAHRRTSDTAETVRAISLSLPLTVRNRLREHARRAALSQVTVLLDAVESTVELLSTLIEQGRPEPADTGMFDRTPARPAATEPYVTVSLRTKATNVATLDDLVKQHGAASRSQLCAVALGAYLDKEHAQAS